MEEKDYGYIKIKLDQLLSAQIPINLQSYIPEPYKALPGFVIGVFFCSVMLYHKIRHSPSV